MRVSVVLAVALLPLWAPLARAQQQPAPVGGSLSLQSQPPTTIAYPALNSQPFGTDHLGGEWGGARPWLEDHGVYLGVNYYPEIAAIVAGGQRQGIDYTSQFGLSVDLDGQKLLGWSGFAVHSVIVQRNGRSAQAPISWTMISMLRSRSLAGAAVSQPTSSISTANSSSAPSSRPRRSTATS
jgi:hypothetical protein